MVDATIDENVTNISGVPTWMVVLLEKILERKNASNILEVWPNLEVFFHGAVSFQPYVDLFHKLIPSNSMKHWYGALISMGSWYITQPRRL